MLATYMIWYLDRNAEPLTSALFCHNMITASMLYFGPGLDMYLLFS